MLQLYVHEILTAFFVLGCCCLKSYHRCRTDLCISPLGLDHQGLEFWSQNGLGQDPLGQDGFGLGWYMGIAWVRLNIAGLCVGLTVGSFFREWLINEKTLTLLSNTVVHLPSRWYRVMCCITFF